MLEDSDNNTETSSDTEEHGFEETKKGEEELEDSDYGSSKLVTNKILL